MPLAASLSLLKTGLTGLAVVALAGFVLIHIVWYIRPSDVKTMDDLQARLTGGKPTIVEWYSNL
ncbi:MAG: hypothetical protein KJ047_08640 [Anaerolineae bacterium]|nr:hypothetical protein [Anaerolineae bacterium]MEB2289434.1 hypothetical protein [Anaerolineae bacterium]